MAIQARKGTDEVLYALVNAHNNTRRATATVASFFHADVTAKNVTGSRDAIAQTSVSVASADASDLATLLTLCAEIKVLYALHMADSLAHKVADTANTVAAAVPTSLATAHTFLNEIKADYNTHRASTTYHYNADSTNTISSADSTDQSSANTLANELKTDLIAHMISAPAGQSVKLVDP